MAETIGALIMDVKGLTLTQDEAALIRHPLIGGVILFARNYADRQQLSQLCRDIRAARETPLLLMVDQEGGRVQRFKDEFSPLPALSEIGQLYADNPQEACKQAELWGLIMAHEVLSAGLDFSLGPVLDLDKGVSMVIGSRAFHADPEVVATLAKAYIKGMRTAGMAATGKHFPGHGAIAADSHVTQATDPRPLQQVLADRRSFELLIQAGIDAIMSAHIVFPVVDDLPVTYSSRWLKDILRQELGFKGVVFSDDLSMVGAGSVGGYADRVQAARDAGCDFALVCNNQAGVIEVLDRLPSAKHQVEQAKWGALQAHESLMPG